MASTYSNTYYYYVQHMEAEIVFDLPFTQEADSANEISWQRHRYAAEVEGFVEQSTGVRGLAERFNDR